MLAWDSFDNSNNQCKAGVCPYLGSQYAVIDKAALLNGSMNPAITFWGPDAGRPHLLPVVGQSSTNVQYAVYLDPPNFHLMTFTRSNGVIITDDSYDVGTGVAIPPPALQPGGTTVWKNVPPRINNDLRLQSAIWQNGVLWAASNDGCLNPLRSCLEFIRFLTNSNSVQATQLASPLQDFYYPAVSLTGSGDLVFGYTTSSPNIFATATVEGIAGGVFGNAQTGWRYQPGSAAYGGVRWGDYSGAAQDPDDLNRIWVAQEFAFNSSPTAPSGIWGTAIAQTCFSTNPLTTACPPPPSPNPPTLAVNVSSTETGPDIHFSGSGYSKNGAGVIRITYSGVPGLQSEAGLQLSTDSNGNIVVPSVDTQFDMFGLYQFCTTNQKNGIAKVSITATDTVSNFQAQTSVAAFYWCP